jgi:hypothetical protein
MRVAQATPPGISLPKTPDQDRAFPRLDELQQGRLVRLGRVRTRSSPARSWLLERRRGPLGQVFQPDPGRKLTID